MSALDDLFAQKPEPAKQPSSGVLPSRSTKPNASALDQLFSAQPSTPTPASVTTIPTPTPATVSTMPKPFAPGPRVSLLKPTTRDVYKDTISAPEPGFFDKPGFFSTAARTIKDVFQDTVQRGVDLTNVILPSAEYSEETKRFEMPKITPAQRGAAMVKAATGAVNLAFAPVSAVLAGAEDIQLAKKEEIPGPFEIPKTILKYGAKAVSYPFKKVSEGATALTEKGFELLPQTEPIQQFKEPATEAVSLLAVLLTGKAIHAAAKTPKAIIEKVGEVKNVNNVVKTASEVLDVPLEKDILGRYKKPDVKEVSSAYRRAAHETHPDRGGSAQEFGVVKAAKNILDDYQALSAKEFNKKWNVPLETVKQGVKGFLEQGTKESVVTSPIEPSNIDRIFSQEQIVPSTSLSLKQASIAEPKIDLGKDLISKTIPTPSVAELPSINAEIQPSVEGLGQTISTTIEAPKIDAIPEPKVKTEAVSRVFSRLKEENPILEDELTYERQNLQANAEKAVELISQDSKKAFRIAMGVETPPVGQTSTAVNIALAEKALEEENHDLYSKLVRNRSIEQTRRGQEIVAEKGSVSDNSTSRYVKELIKTRLDKLGASFLGNLNDKMLRKTSGKKAVEVIDREVAKVKEKIKSNKELDLEEAQAFLDSLACK